MSIIKDNFQADQEAVIEALNAAAEEARDLAAAVRGGDYSQRLSSAEGTGPLSDLCDSINRMVNDFGISQDSTGGGMSAERRADLEGQIAAISKAQAVIEFDLDGSIQTANDNFLNALGYTLGEVQGHHHRMFVTPEEAASAEYKQFWDKLGRGEYDAGRYRRIAKDGAEVWIQASYNPIFDASGKAFKVVKYATDITAQVEAERAINAAVDETQAVVAAAQDGDLSQRIPVEGKEGQLEALCSGINEMLDGLAENQQRELVAAAENLRIKNALDGVTTNVMIADNERNIIYMNDSIGEMLRTAESDIQKDLPDFSVKGLDGANIDQFHKNPQHQIRMIEGLTETYRTEIELGGRTFALVASPVINADGERLGTVVEWKDRTAELALENEIKEREEQEKIVAAANLRIRNALDGVTTNVMIADNERNIIYMNESIREMLQTAESDIQKDLPDFSVKGLDGANIDQFHKNPQHQIRMLEDLTSTYRTEIELGGRTFALVASPVIDADGTRLGTVVEWKDRTAELALENEIKEREEQEKIVAAANLRIKNALDGVTTNVMIADNERNIIYMNDSIGDMLRTAESDIQKDLPNFSVKGLDGANIDQFHKNPQHQIRMLEDLTSTYRTEIELGGRTFALVASPVIDQEGTRLGTVVEWKDRTSELKLENEIKQREEREREIAAENLRIKNALDNVTTNVMIADVDRNVVYMNESVRAMLSNAEADIRKAMPNFDVSKIIGGNIDQYHKNPAHQQRMLEALNSTYKTEITVGGRIFGLIANPIVSSEGERVGSVVEWNDRTLEAAVESEIGEIIDGAGRGEFSARLNLEDKEGFFERLAGGINQLLESCEVGFNDVIRVLSALSKGDLTEKIEADYEGTFGELKDNLNETIRSLTDMVESIKEASDSINSAAGDIAAGSTDLSGRTEEQAASLEETASSMEELTSTVKQNAENAKQANQLSIGASDVATKGGEVVGEVVSRMADITDASKKIEDIISVIEGIAFQTNILALNAAVEAARAGEQGRGFAVVASEVRSLAQRSSGAAKEIKTLIGDSVTQIEDGSRLVGQAGTTMEEIVSSVKRVTDIMAEISAASQEQSSGIEQVNQTIAQMDEATQQNAALVEESSASARSLEEQAGVLGTSVSRFRIDESAGGGGGQPARAERHAPPASHQPAARKVEPRAKPAPAKDEGHGDNWSEF